jgi:hypothetical protein
MPYRERKLKALMVLVTISVILPLVLLTPALLRGGGLPPRSVLMLLVLAAVLVSAPLYIYPRRVLIWEDGTVEVLVGLRKLRISGQVVKIMSTREVESVLHLCPLGLRVSLNSLFYGLCFSDLGRVTVISTPGCSGTWLLVEDGKKYLICCEERDRERCRV